MRNDIIQWNVNGVRSRYAELQQLIYDEEPAILCLQETHLRPEHSLSIRGYRVHRHDHLAGVRANGGCAILVKNSIMSSAINIQSTIQNIVIRIHLPTIEFTIACVYLPPDLELTIRELQFFVDQLPAPFLLVGDFNASHHRWGSMNDNDRGHVIVEICTRLNLITLNTGAATHLSLAHGTYSMIDLSICSPVLSAHMEWSVMDDLHGSDHFPIRLRLSVSCPTESRWPNWVIKKADWTGFAESLSFNDNENDDVDLIIEHFCTNIIRAAELHVPRSSSTPRRVPVPWWTEGCRDAILARKRALRLFQRHPTEENFIQFKRFRAKARRTICEAKKVSWTKYVSSLKKNVPATTVWGKVRRIMGRRNSAIPGLVHNGNMITNHLDMAELLVTSFTHISSSVHYEPRFLRIKEAAERNDISFISDNTENYNTPFTLQELQSALDKSPDTSPGPDNIHNQMLRNLPPAGKIYLLSLYNRIWTEKSFPSQWHKAIVVPVQKPGKDPSLPNSYRPICLTSCVCKVMERMVSNRLMWFLESENLLSKIQCGFRKRRSTADHLVRLEGAIRDAFLKKEHLVAIFFDLEKAYDTTWRYGILRTIHNWGLRGSLPTFLANFLAERYFRVRIGTTLSSEHLQENGVPQGSVLSVLLFSIAINGIAANISPHVTPLLYVDDFSLYYSSRYLPSIGRQLQLAINTLSEWAICNGFKFSTAKTQCIHFVNSRGLHPHPELRLNGVELHYTDTAKFLGLIFDSKLSWEAHIRDLRRRCEKSLNILRILSGVHWGADRKTLLRIYRAVVRSKLDYGSFIYGSANKSKLKMLDPIHHQGLRLATGAFRTSRIESLYCESGEPSLYQRRNMLLCSYGVKLRAQPEHNTYKHFHSMALDFRYRRDPRRPRPAGVRFREGLSELDIRLPNIKVIEYPPTPPWIMNRPKFDLSLSQSLKNFTPNFIYRQRFYEILSQLPYNSIIYTDGSRVNDRVGCSFVVDGQVYKYKLSLYTSVFTAELYAIYRALLFLIRQPRGRFLICSDSLSAIQSLQSYYCDDSLIVQTQVLFHSLLSSGSDVGVVWVPGHVGIPGNETADAGARDAALNGTLVYWRERWQDVVTYIRNCIRRDWEEKWSAQAGNKLRPIKNTVREWDSSSRASRRDEVILTRLRIGHCRLTHGHLLSGEPPPECDTCHALLTVEHFLLHCRKYDLPRRQYAIRPTLRDALGNDFNCVNAVLRYLRNTELDKVI